MPLDTRDWPRNTERWNHAASEDGRGAVANDDQSILKFAMFATLPFKFFTTRIGLLLPDELQRCHACRIVRSKFVDGTN